MFCIGKCVRRLYKVNMSVVSALKLQPYYICRRQIAKDFLKNRTRELYSFTNMPYNVGINYKFKVYAGFSLFLIFSKFSIFFHFEFYFILFFFF
jgi:hypothetical protein